MEYILFSTSEFLITLKVLGVVLFWLSVIGLVVFSVEDANRTVRYMRYVYIQGVRVKPRDYIKFYKYCSSTSQYTIQSGNGSYWNNYKDWYAVPQEPIAKI